MLYYLLGNRLCFSPDHSAPLISRMARKVRDTAETLQAQPEAGDRFVFLSPEWIAQAVTVLETAKQRDPYLSGLVADFTLKVAYVIEDAPPRLRSRCGNGSKLVIRVALRNGVVEDVKIGTRMPSQPVDLVVTVGYRLAEKLFRGEIGVASTILGGHVQAKPVNGFTAWARIAAKSLVTASQFLKTARKIPTSFIPQS